jgi:phosphoserine phosphatase
MDEILINIIVGAFSLVAGIVIGKLIFASNIVRQFEISYQQGAGAASAIISGKSKAEALLKFESAYGYKQVISVKTLI